MIRKIHKLFKAFKYEALLDDNGYIECEDSKNINKISNKTTRSGQRIM
jgi:hypothetical protein